MTYFTDSIYEKMMVQKPKYGREKKSPAIENKDRNKDDKSKHYREPIIPKERNEKK